MTRLRALLVLLLSLTSVEAASAQGFSLSRYHPPPAGDGFLLLEHPWYSGTRYFAGGLTLDYGNRSLVARGDSTQPVLEHQLIGHFDLALALIKRIGISFSLPVYFLERGSGALGVAPLDKPAVGDPRIGLRVRLFGEVEESPVAMSVSGYVFVPVKGNEQHVGDEKARGIVRVILGGAATRFAWSLNLGFLLRPTATLGTGQEELGNRAGHEFHAGFGVQLVLLERALRIGPELAFASIIKGAPAFRSTSSSLEAALGIHYTIKRQVAIGVAGGFGAFSAPGQPAARALFRIAYAPQPRPPAPEPGELIETTPTRPVDNTDTDGDGIPDRRDACVDVPGVAHDRLDYNGCPPRSDRDGDGMYDDDDPCPDAAPGTTPDVDMPGCPATDLDRDGVLDRIDRCKTEAQGAFPDPTQPGCPQKDDDGDGVYNHEDECPAERMGLLPDPAHRGCPLPDADGDMVPDAIDACPQQAGGPSATADKNGCVTTLVIKGDRLELHQPLRWNKARTELSPESVSLLDQLADALVAMPTIRRLAIELRAEGKGTPRVLQALADRQARYLVEQLVRRGVSSDRIVAKGYLGGSAGRPLELRILEPKLVK